MPTAVTRNGCIEYSAQARDGRDRDNPSPETMTSPGERALAAEKGGLEFSHAVIRVVTSFSTIILLAPWSSAMSTPASRRPVACQRCHRKKIKCTCEPSAFACRNCIAAQETCVFPTRDRVVTISEAYIRDLQQRAIAHSQYAMAAPTPVSQTGLLGLHDNPLLETQESWIGRLKHARDVRRTTPPPSSDYAPWPLLTCEAV